ncbi:MAG: sulfatase [Planctomycetota bacterium]
MSQRPNVVYLNSHDTGRYIQPYGHALKTPHLQKLAEEGVLFRKAFCNAPTCSPSRAALLTGTYAHQCGMLGLCHRGFLLSDPQKHLAPTLARHGYTTAQSGVQHVSPNGEKEGEDVVPFDVHLDPEAVRSKIEPVLDWLKGRKASDGSFYLEVGFGETHRTNGIELQWHNGENSPAGDPRYVSVPAPLPDHPAIRSDFADYGQAVERLDAYYGQIIDALSAAGLADDTLLIVTTDHGIAYPGMKCSLTDHGTGVLLIVRGPSDSPFRGGKVVDAATQHLDLFPTICDVAGLDAPDWLEGKSLVPLCDGSLNAEQPDALHDELFAEVTYHAAYEPKRSVRTARYKYIRYFDDDFSKPVLPNIDPSISKDVLLSHGGLSGDVPREQLYDLVLDPHEANNLADRSTHDQALQSHRESLAAWMRRTDDPLLKGPVHAPRELAMNPRTDPHPTSPTITMQTGDPAP